MTKSEKMTEGLIRKAMGFELDKNDFDYVYPQGDASKISGKLKEALNCAGGKPKFCPLDDFSCDGKGEAKPEFVVTFNRDSNTIIVI